VQIIKYLQEGYKRFATGIYLIWYPIVDENSIKNFHQRVKNLGIEQLLITEIIIDQRIESGFKGCGMLIVNAPYQLDEELSVALPLMLKYLQKDYGKIYLSATSQV
jgi:23S rRNA (adenine2030-N6)-methyltransferase